MKWGYRLFWIATFLSAVSLSLSACGKKEEEASVGIVGPVSVSGNIVTSNTMLNGRMANVVISRMESGFGATPINGQPNYGGGGMSSLLVDISVNGQMRQLSVQLNGYPQTVNQGMIADVMVSTYGACGDAYCETAYLIVEIRHQSYGSQYQMEAKQIGIFKNLREDRVRSSIAVQALDSQSSLYTIQQMMEQLYAHRQ